MERIEVRLTQAQKDTLLDLSRERLVPVSALVRAAIEEFLDRNAKGEWERAVDAAFGIMPDLPDGDTYERAMRAAWGERSRERMRGE